MPALNTSHQQRPTLSIPDDLHGLTRLQAGRFHGLHVQLDRDAPYRPSTVGGMLQIAAKFDGRRGALQL